MNTIIGRYDVDASPYRKTWLRNSFVFQTQPIPDPTAANPTGVYVGRDEASVQEQAEGLLVGDMFLVLITEALRDEFFKTTTP